MCWFEWPAGVIIYLSNLAVLPPGEQEKLADYHRQLADALVTVIGKAIGSLAPAIVKYGEGSAAFEPGHPPQMDRSEDVSSIRADLSRDS